jgi:uncharacterized membrane protein
VSDLLVIEFSSEVKAYGVREILLAMRKEYLIDPGDAVVVVRDPNGRIKLNQLLQPVKQGALSGTFWASLIGLLFLNPLAGGGTASGALGGKLTDLGINDDFMREAARTLQSGNAVLFLLIRKMTTDKVLSELRRVRGTVLRISFDETKEEVLQAALADAQEASDATGP